MLEKNRLARYKKLAMEKRIWIERMEVNNLIYEKLKTQYDDIVSVKGRVDDYVEALDYLSNLIVGVELDYRNYRLDCINAVITDVLGEIFPQERFQAKVVCDFKNTTNKSYLRLIRPDGSVSMPIIGEGKLCQYLISYASVLGILRMLGYKNLYVDEAFGVAAKERLGQIGGLIERAANDGMQILLVSQDNLLYADLARREIHLKKDYNQNCVVITEVKDFG